MTRIEQLKKFIDQDPSDSFALYALGLEYVNNGNYTEAENCFRHLLFHHPAYIGTYFQFGKLLQALRREDEAKTIFEKGMEVTRQTDLKTYSELQNALTNMELGLD